MTSRSGHQCPKCGSKRVQRRGLHGWFEHAVLPRLHRHAYHCEECGRRFWDRPQSRREHTPPLATSEERHARRAREWARRRWRLREAMRLGGPLEKTPYSRVRAYLAIGLAWLTLLALFFALRAYWPAGDTVVRALD